MKNNEIKIVDAFNEIYLELGSPEGMELVEYGITYKELQNPTLETIKKLKRYAIDLSYVVTKHK